MFNYYNYNNNNNRRIAPYYFTDVVVLCIPKRFEWMKRATRIALYTTLLYIFNAMRACARRVCTTDGDSGGVSSDHDTGLAAVARTQSGSYRLESFIDTLYSIYSMYVVTGWRGGICRPSPALSNLRELFKSSWHFIREQNIRIGRREHNEKLWPVEKCFKFLTLSIILPTLDGVSAR